MSTRTSTTRRIVTHTGALSRVGAETVARAPRYRLDVHSPSRRCSVLRAKGDLDMTARAEFASTLATSHTRRPRRRRSVRGDLHVLRVASMLADAVHIRPGRFHVVAPTRQVRMLLDILAPDLDVTADAAPCDAGTAPAA